MSKFQSVWPCSKLVATETAVKSGIFSSFAPLFFISCFWSQLLFSKAFKRLKAYKYVQISVGSALLNLLAT